MKKLFAATLAIASTLFASGTSLLGESKAIAAGSRDPVPNQNAIEKVMRTLGSSFMADGKVANNIFKNKNNQLTDQSKSSTAFATRSLQLAQLVPQDAVGFVVLDLDTKSWQALEQFDIPSKNPLAAIDVLLGFLALDEDLSVAQDIQPWIGKELAIAVLARDKGKDQDENCVCVGTAIAAKITDNSKFDALVAKLEKLDLPKPTQTTYKTVIIREWNLQGSVTSPQVQAKLPQQLLAMVQPLSRTKDHEDDDQENENESENENEAEDFLPAFNLKGFAIAQLPNGTAVFASDRQTLEQMIDTSIGTGIGTGIATGDSSLAQSPLFLRSLQNPLWDRSLFAGYGNYASMGRLTELLAADLPEESPIPGFSRSEYIQTLKYTISEYSTFDLFTWITPKGIRSQSISYFTQQRSPQAKDTTPRDRLLSMLPNNVYGSISSRNLNQQWQWLVKASENLPVYKVFVEGTRMIVPLAFGVDGAKTFDIEKDVISWIDGEYAFVVFPSERSPLQSFGIDLTMGMLIRTSQPEAANAALAKFTKILIGEDGYSMVKKRQVGATLMTSLEVFDDIDAGTTRSVIAYGWRDPQTLLITLGSGTAAEFSPTPNPALADSEMFRDAIADMPQPNFGYFYLNVNAIARQVANIALAAGAFPNDENSDESSDSGKPQLPAIADQIINKLGGAVFVYSETSDRLQTDAFLGLKK